MARVYFITHPDVLIDPKVPVTAWPLSPRGRERMLGFVNQFRVHDLGAVWCSTERKAVDAAEIIGKAAGLEPRRLADLGENDRSATGFLPEAVFEATADRFFATPDESIRGWETAVAAQRRIIGAVATVLAQAPTDRDVAIVSHGAVGALLLCHIKRCPISRADDQPGGAGGNYYCFDRATYALWHGWRPIEDRRIVGMHQPDANARHHVGHNRSETGHSMTTALPTEPFGQLPDGRAGRVFTLENAHIRVRITDFGGRMVSIEAPDRDGRRNHVLLGLGDVAAYSAYGGSFGTLLGRYANRIAGAQFSLDGRTHHLSKNNGDATLHGGAVGFNRVFWTVAAAEADPAPQLVLRYLSPDGDQGFPGELTAQAVYRLEADTLSLTLEAQTTQPTVVNLSAHPYFNLGGTASGDVLGHELTVAAEAFLPTDAAQVPTGEIRSVAGTPFDFRGPALLGSRIRTADPQLFHGLGYDHCLVLAMEVPNEPLHAVRVHDPASGRVLEIETNQPGVQVYSGNKLTGAFAGHGGVVYRQSAGLALEPQDFPDAPHHPQFPSTVLRPSATYRRVIRYRFSTT